MEKTYLKDCKLGEKFESRGRIMTEADVRILIACSGAEHPVHTDPIFASKMAIGRPIMQGCLMLGVVDTFFSETVFTTGEPVLTYGYEKIRFIRPVYINDVVRGEFELLSQKKKDTMHSIMTYKATVYNQNDEVVFSAEETFFVENHA